MQKTGTINFTQIRIDRIIRAFKVKRIKGEEKNIYNRASCGMIVSLSGNMSYVISEHKYVQTPDTVIIIPGNTSYTVYCTESSECIVIDFDEFTDVVNKKVLLVNTISRNMLYEKAHKLCNVWEISKKDDNLKCLSLFYEILDILNMSFTMSKKEQKLYKKIKPSIEYLANNYSAEKINNDQLAEISHISNSYFRKIFFELYGVSPMKYVEIRKIEKAKELLDVEDMNVTEIARSCGFNDVYFFSRTFKKITGFSPNKYRKTILKQY